MIKVKARATYAPDGKFSLTDIERREVGPKDVLIEIKYAGICHSDIHTALEHWGKVNFPLVPGHEIAGIVSEVGKEVTKYKVGDRVGVGCMVDSCGVCECCHEDLEQYCLNGNVQTYNDTDRFGDGQKTQGGYSDKIVVKEDFVLRIPDSIPLEKAAPILCAGVTTYSPLKHWQIENGKKLAVLGMGGLGHMAVKIAKVLGADVTVLSHTPEKKDDALAFGASEFYDIHDPQTFRKLRNNFDFILNTIANPFDVNPYFPLLKLNGTLINVGAPGEPYHINIFSLLGNRTAFAGSCIGGIKETQEVLDFCAEHNITPEIKIISGNEIDQAYEAVQDCEVRYRYVIDIAQL